VKIANPRNSTSPNAKLREGSENAIFINNLGKRKGGTVKGSENSKSNLERIQKRKFGL